MAEKACKSQRRGPERALPGDWAAQPEAEARVPEKPRKRIGRGEGSTPGKTSGRGHGGAGSRAGSQAQGRL